MVKQGRGARLKGPERELFSGDFWLGDQAVTLGLADGIGNLYSVMHREFKVSEFVDYSSQPSLLQDIVSGIGSEITFAVATQGRQSGLLAKQLM